MFDDVKKTTNHNPSDTIPKLTMNHRATGVYSNHNQPSCINSASFHVSLDVLMVPNSAWHPYNIVISYNIWIWFFLFPNYTAYNVGPPSQKLGYSHHQKSAINPMHIPIFSWWSHHFPSFSQGFPRVFQRNRSLLTNFHQVSQVHRSFGAGRHRIRAKETLQLHLPGRWARRSAVHYGIGGKISRKP